MQETLGAGMARVKAWAMGQSEEEDEEEKSQWSATFDPAAIAPKAAASPEATNFEAVYLAGE